MKKGMSEGWRNWVKKIESLYPENKKKPPQKSLPTEKKQNLETLLRFHFEKKKFEWTKRQQNFLKEIINIPDGGEVSQLERKEAKDLLQMYFPRQRSNPQDEIVKYFEETPKKTGYLVKRDLLKIVNNDPNELKSVISTLKRRKSLKRNNAWNTFLVKYEASQEGKILPKINVALRDMGKRLGLDKELSRKISQLAQEINMQKPENRSYKKYKDLLRNVKEAQKIKIS